MIVNEMQIHIVLNKINVGNDFLIDAQINEDDVANVKKCIYHNSIPNINPGTMIIAFAIHEQNSIVL
jgi:Cu/Ag efflux protein CusF